MVFCMLQQPIRWAEWSFACCNNPFGGQNGVLHGCNNLFGGQNGLLHVATTHLEGLNGLLHVATTYSVGRMGFYMVATQFRTRANLCCIVEPTLPPCPNGCFPNIPVMCYKQMER